MGLCVFERLLGRLLRTKREPDSNGFRSCFKKLRYITYLVAGVQKVGFVSIGVSNWAVVLCSSLVISSHMVRKFL